MENEKYRMRCLVVTPESKVLDTGVQEVILSMLDGKIGIRPGHSPLLCELKSEVLRYKDSDWEEYQLFVDGGFAHVRDNEIIVLSPAVIKPGQVEALQARKTLEDAFALPSSGPGQTEKRRVAIERAHRIMAFVEGIQV